MNYLQLSDAPWLTLLVLSPIAGLLLVMLAGALRLDDRVVKLGATRECPQSPCDTVAIDCERKVVCLTWRASLRVQGRVQALQWIKIQPAGRPA